MDPKATVQRLIDAANSGDKREWLDARADMLHWLRHGGFAARVRHETGWEFFVQHVGSFGVIGPYHEDTFKEPHVLAVNCEVI